MVNTNSKDLFAYGISFLFSWQDGGDDGQNDEDVDDAEDTSDTELLPQQVESDDERDGSLPATDNARKVWRRAGTPHTPQREECVTTCSHEYEWL